jgi:hypothetical protein
VVPLPVRGQPNGWDLRRRLAAVVLAAALVLVPATMASAAALPGQPMYPFKRAIEELRIASVQWSPSREATERTRVVDARVDELDRLVELNMYNQLLPALDALKQAVVEAQAALDDARQEGEPSGKAEVRLDSIVVASRLVLARVAIAAKNAPVSVNGDTARAIASAVAETQDVLTPGQDTGSGGATPTPGSQPNPPDPASAPSNPTQPQPQPSVTTPANPTTTGSPVTTTTTPPTTTTEPDPSTTETTVTPGSAGGGGDTGGDQAGVDGRTAGDAAPAEQAPADVPTP